MGTFEFLAYRGDADGKVSEKSEQTIKQFDETSAAKAFAGRLAKKVNGPVDVARAYLPPEQSTRDWADRYITTVSPCELNASGYRLERLS